MREPVGRVPHLGYDRVQQAQTKVARFAKVTGRHDCETFFLSFNMSLLCQSSHVFLTKSSACF